MVAAIAKEKNRQAQRRFRGELFNLQHAAAACISHLVRHAQLEVAHTLVMYEDSHMCLASAHLQSHAHVFHISPILHLVALPFNVYSFRIELLQRLVSIFPDQVSRPCSALLTCFLSLLILSLAVALLLTWVCLAAKLPRCLPHHTLGIHVVAFPAVPAPGYIHCSPPEGDDQ
jgi:hypothetical protein